MPLMQTPELAKAQQEWTEADRVCRALERERDEAIKAAKARIEAEFRGRIQEASMARSAAHTAKWKAENAAADAHRHEWDGKVVVMREPVYSRWGAELLRYEERRGVVFTYKHTDDLGAYRRYGLPNPGDALVRLLKKDGTPGTRWERLSETGTSGVKWELDNG